jgi:gamma-glutamylcyclotransferase (GGCT)/AIG2-like uncharacterized protein YtfP
VAPTLSEGASFLAVYGTLRRRSLAKQDFFVQRNLRFHGYGVLKGLLFIQNGYPGVLEQPGLVNVEVYRVLSEIVWVILDRYEGYRPSLGSRALFYRKEVTLLHPAIQTWVYFLGREVPRGAKLPCSWSPASRRHDSPQKISIFKRSADPDSH